MTFIVVHKTFEKIQNDLGFHSGQISMAFLELAQ